MRDACDESTFPQPHHSLRLTFVFPSALHLPQTCALCLPVLLSSSGAEGLSGHLSNCEAAGPSPPPSPELCPGDSGCALIAIKGGLRREKALGTPWHDEKAVPHGPSHHGVVLEGLQSGLGTEAKGNGPAETTTPSSVLAVAAPGASHPDCVPPWVSAISPSQCPRKPAGLCDDTTLTSLDPTGCTGRA